MILCISAIKAFATISYVIEYKEISGLVPSSATAGQFQDDINLFKKNLLPVMLAEAGIQSVLGKSLDARLKRA